MADVINCYKENSGPRRPLCVDPNRCSSLAMKASLGPRQADEGTINRSSTTVAFPCHAFDSDIARPSPGVDIAIVSI